MTRDLMLSRCALRGFTSLLTSRVLSRTFAVTSRLKPASKSTVLLTSPSPKYLEQEELDVDLIPQKDINIEVTDRAAEVDSSHAILWSLNCVATIVDIRPAVQSECRTQNSGRIRWMPWVSV